MGRLSQAFCDQFDGGCDGVDIAPSMVDLARQHNRHGDRCRYHLNTRNDLSAFPDSSFSFVYTALVLQHMRPRYALNYIREFCRVLEPGGVAMFQAPGEIVPGGEAGSAPTRAAVAEPLPEGACRAQITLLNLPADRPAGLQFELRVSVRNICDTSWPTARTADGRFQLVVANRWLDPAGTVIESGDGRTLLPHDVAPGESVEVPVIVAPPEHLGPITLEVDVVEEAAGRFAPRGGGSAASARLEIVPAPEHAQPVIQMYGISKRRVLALVEECGCTARDVAETGAAGPHWTSYTYSVTRGRGF
jgi:SAM-dependent methyltransferase